MTWGRAVLIGCLLWLAVLFLLLQPHSHPLPKIEHAHPLEPTAGPLPTLAPIRH